MSGRDHVGTPWIGVDLDGTLAVYEGWKGMGHIGIPIPKMVKRVQAWLKEGKTVKVLTARVCHDQRQEEVDIFLRAYKHWCFQNIGQQLPVTCEKDYSMVELWDDRCVQVDRNTGEEVTDTFYLSKIMSQIREKNHIPSYYPANLLPELLVNININLKRLGWEECANALIPGGITVNWTERYIASNELECNGETLHEDWGDSSTPQEALKKLQDRIRKYYQERKWN